ncbi:EAL domain-containing protein [Roseibium suaedae]|uniref:Cyclic-di-GMP phosphodiesterase, flagellum assembly factor TipF n=1 Tax=Roseibium suaedae TaxID=735517 RepID=A0A1M7AMQ5_9HYPH|nr:EAL domain-containing protein [Roseibium suaedae]SHL44031.1 cyclic-di-GMP phosphodiesterase, flagellum assembly factor TipF [Roseibium suaedae]
MGRIATIFIVICMAVIAMSVSAVLVFQFGRPFGEAVSLSLALMCTMILLHLLLSRSRERSSVTEAVERLEDRMNEIDEDVGNLEGRLTGVEHTIPRRTREEIDPLFAEVEVLGTLVKQMAEAMSDLETRFEDQQQLPPPPQMQELPHYGQRSSYDNGPLPHLQNQQGNPYVPQSASAAPSPDRAGGYVPQQPARDYGNHAPSNQGYAAPPVMPQSPMSRPAAQAAPQVSTSGPDDYARAPAPAPRPSAPAASDPGMRELILSALNANRVELHLQPIVTLPQRQVKYYEAFTRLRDSQGELIDAATFLPEAVRSGLIARIDNLQLFRSVQVIRRLTARNRNAALFCNVSSLSLVDETFFPGFLEFVRSNKSFADVIVFEFSQEDVAQMGVMEMESLSALAEIGFHFSVDRITDMKMDFKTLAQRGFKYAKLHADYLIGRRAADHGHIHPSDFGDLLHRYGIELIPDHVETESQVLELLDYEVKLAQGNLFSPPRPVRAEVLQGAPAPAARKRA